MSKDYLHIFNDLLKELERKKKNPFPKRKYSKKFKIPKFLRPKKAKGINIDYGTAGSKITEKHKK